MVFWSGQVNQEPAWSRGELSISSVLTFVPGGGVECARVVPKGEIL